MRLTKLAQGIRHNDKSGRKTYLQTVCTQAFETGDRYERLFMQEPIKWHCGSITSPFPLSTFHRLPLLVCRATSPFPLPTFHRLPLLVCKATSPFPLPTFHLLPLLVCRATFPFPLPTFHLLPLLVCRATSPFLLPTFHRLPLLVCRATSPFLLPTFHRLPLLVCRATSPRLPLLVCRATSPRLPLLVCRDTYPEYLEVGWDVERQVRLWRASQKSAYDRCDMLICFSVEPTVRRVEFCFTWTNLIFLSLEYITKPVEQLAETDWVKPAPLRPRFACKEGNCCYCFRKTRELIEGLCIPFQKKSAIDPLLDSRLFPAKCNAATLFWVAMDPTCNKFHKKKMILKNRSFLDVTFSSKTRWRWLVHQLRTISTSGPL
jgi:hypothetical protein